MRLGVLRMTATGLRLSRGHRPVLDAFVLSAALGRGRRFRCGRRLLSDTRAGKESKQKSERNGETWLVLEHEFLLRVPWDTRQKVKAGLSAPDRLVCGCKWIPRRI